MLIFVCVSTKRYMLWEQAAMKKILFWVIYYEFVSCHSGSYFISTYRKFKDGSRRFTWDTRIKYVVQLYVIGVYMIP